MYIFYVYFGIPTTCSLRVFIFNNLHLRTAGNYKYHEF